MDTYSPTPVDYHVNPPAFVEWYYGSVSQNSIKMAEVFAKHPVGKEDYEKSLFRDMEFSCNWYPDYNCVTGNCDYNSTVKIPDLCELKL